MIRGIPQFLLFLTALWLVSSGTWAAMTFETCVDRLKRQALDTNISPRVVETVFADVRYLPRVIELDRKQPEFSQTFYGYYSQRVTDFRVLQGRKLLEFHSELLNSLARQYGVPAHYLVAFWGMETNFGRHLGKINVLDSLTTLACDPRRSEFFTTELMDALWLVQTGVAGRDTMLGSWAGAMGNMQFMPSTYRRYARDADKDGKADLWNSLEDAFTSAALYLQQLGWEPEWRWGREVLLPQDFDYSLAGRDKPQPLKFWASAGVLDSNKSPLPDLDKTAAVLVPSGHKGPAFLVYDNFNVILKWNLSEFYALSVGILADRIKGEDGLHSQPPKHDPFTISVIKSLQTNLNVLGFDAGKVDGIFGTKTKESLRLFQKQHGFIADGFPHRDVIKALTRLASEKSGMNN